MALIFQQIMTPNWLAKNARPGNGVSLRNDEHTFVVNYEGGGVHKNLLSVKLHDLVGADLGVASFNNIMKAKDTSLVVALEVSFDRHYGIGEAAPMHPVHVMLSDGKSVLGFRIEGNVQNYARKGPYNGARATLTGDTFQNYVPIDSRIERAVAPTIFPQVFRMLLKPKEGWGVCSSAVESGYLLAVDYGSSLSLSPTNITLALYSDDQVSSDEYRLNYIDVSIFKEN